MSLRSLSELSSDVGQPVRDAIRAIEARGGRYTHDSGHTKAPTWIYSFPSRGGVQLALRINREKLSVYLQASPQGRVEFESELSAWGEIEQHYPNVEGDKPANSLLSEEHAPYLTPLRHRLLRVRVHEGQFEALLDAYLGSSSQEVAGGASSTADLESAADVAAADVGSVEPTEAVASRALVITPEQLRQQLDRQDETGKAGERIAYLDELDRLSRRGCPNPSACVQITAVSNIAAGYDLVSEWNGERRHIEVKTTASGRDDCYLSENERMTLARLGSEAWLYRVDLRVGEEGAVVQRIQDPIAAIDPACFTPVVWRLDLGPSASNDSGTEAQTIKHQQMCPD